MSEFWERLLKRFGLKGTDADPTRPTETRGQGAERRVQEWRSGAPAPTPSPAPALENPYINKRFVGLNQDDWSQQTSLLRSFIWSTPWHSRQNLIPPQSDRRTALIDRGMVLRGVLTEAQVVEMHRVGDAWLKYKNVYASAQALAADSAEAAVEQLRAEKRARKVRLRAEAAARRRARAEAIEHRFETDIIFVGRGVSHRLWDRRAHIEKLEAAGLPVLASPADLAAWLDLGVPALRWLAYHADAVTHPHYVQFKVPKRTGGTRTLSAPMPILAAAQERILKGILAGLPVEDCAHSFVPGRSTITGARPHVGRDVLIKLDLKDFFPTVIFPRVRGLFQSLGYSPAVATLMGLVCTESPRRRVVYDGEPYFVAIGDRSLPQGACTSPALSNLVTRRLDRRLRGASAAKGWVYTRYADDLTFSAPRGHRGDIGWIIARSRHLAAEEGFILNESKVRVLRRAGRQSVLGIGVNDKPGLRRREVRQLRAILHNARHTGLAAQNRDERPDFEAWLRGKLAYLAMIDPDRGRPMLAQLNALLAPA